MVTVTNWAAYQQSEDDAHHTSHHSEHHAESENATHYPPQQTPRAATLSKEVKNLNKKYTSNSDELDSAAANQSPEAEHTTSRKSRGIDPDVRTRFETEFWPMYPRRQGKQPALKAAGSKATTPGKRAFFLSRLQSQLPTCSGKAKTDGASFRWLPPGSTRIAPKMNMNCRVRARAERLTLRRKTITRVRSALKTCSVRCRS
jgi:hypothetical protein